jgi:hypothetical protein
MVSRFGVAALTQLIKSLGGKAVTRKNISFLGGKGPKQSLFNRPLTPREISTSFGPGTKGGLRDLNPQAQSLLDDSFGYLNSNKLNDIQKTILGNNLTNLRNFQLKPPSTPRGGIITSQSFKDLYFAGGRGSDFRDLGVRLARQKKNRFPGKVTKEVQAVLKEIDNRIVAKGDITIKQFNRLSEIQKNRLRRIEEPSIAELFPFLKFAEGGRVNFESGANSDYQQFEKFMEERGQAMKEFELQQLLEEFNEYIKSSQGPEVIEAAEGGMIKDKGLANILAV